MSTLLAPVHQPPAVVDAVMLWAITKGTHTALFDHYRALVDQHTRMGRRHRPVALVRAESQYAQSELRLAVRETVLLEALREANPHLSDAELRAARAELQAQA